MTLACVSLRVMTAVLQPPIVRFPRYLPYTSTPSVHVYLSLSLCLPLDFRIYPSRLLRGVRYSILYIFFIPRFGPSLLVIFYFLGLHMTLLGVCLLWALFHGVGLAASGALGWVYWVSRGQRSNLDLPTSPLYRIKQYSGSLCVVTLHGRSLLIKRPRLFRHV